MNKSVLLGQPCAEWNDEFDSARAHCTHGRTDCGHGLLAPKRVAAPAFRLRVKRSHKILSCQKLVTMSDGGFMKASRLPFRNEVN